MAILVAAVITFVLFVSMRGMINIASAELEEPTNQVSIDWEPTRQETELRTKSDKLPERKMPKPLPSAPQVKSIETSGPGTTVVLPAEAVEVEVETDFSQGIDLGRTSDNAELVPQVRIPAMYPRAAREQHIEGWVKLRFDVTKTGATTNIRVVAGYPKGVFDRAAVRAIEKWKYRPRRVDGKPVMTRNQSVRLDFDLQ